MTRLTAECALRLKAEIAEADGREVSFVADVDGDGMVVRVDPVARGTVDSVLALPGVARRGQMVLHNHPSGVLDPSQADLHVAATLHDGGVGFGIVDNEATKLYVVVEVPKPRRSHRLDPVAVADELGREGPVREVLGADEYEDRPGQRDMTSYVADAYNDGGVAVLEAGTGVGKSFAYLLPALRWAESNDERTIVSTNTINLQEQLVGKDLPLMERALRSEEWSPRFALLKGWRNYLCRARLEVARSTQGELLENGRQLELNQLTEWAQNTIDGSLSDLTETPSDEVWDEVSAEPDLCNRLECPHFDSCFFFEARKRASDADVVVVNHHLLAADLAVRKLQENWQESAVLPPYRRLVIDEAHHLEDTAAQHLGRRVGSLGVIRLFSRLERNGKGLIPSLIHDLRAAEDLLGEASIELLRSQLLPALDDARRYSANLFLMVARLLEQNGGQVLRLDDSFADHPVWDEGLGVELDNFARVLARLRDGVETVADRLELDDETDRRSKLVMELRGVVRRLEAVQDGVLLTLRPQPGVTSVRWIEKRGSRGSHGLPFHVGLVTVPLELAPILRDALFDRVDTVVLTSATLGARGDFSFLENRLGLDRDPSPVRTRESLPSPFDFTRQCLLGIPTDLPDPRRDETGHDLALANVIEEMAHASDGGMFVLFTSHAALRRAGRALRQIGHGRWPLLVQGEDQRDRLLRRFRESGAAILLGTDSFWEGVDVRGHALRTLVIAKLPFKVPTEPLTAARLELLREQGVDGFTRYQVPQAALKLKQGFGRLIRTSRDVGVVLIMDHRIVSRPYGRYLLEGLPPARQAIGRWPEVRGQVEEFFQEQGIGVGN